MSVVAMAVRIPEVLVTAAASDRSTSAAEAVKIAAPDSTMTIGKSASRAVACVVTFAIFYKPMWVTTEVPTRTT